MGCRDVTLKSAAPTSQSFAQIVDCRGLPRRPKSAKVDPPFADGIRNLCFYQNP